MANSFFGLHIGTSGLYAANTWLNITGNNIANGRTEGYSRQTATQQATTPIRVYQRFGEIGTGVEVFDVRRIRDEYYDVKYWENQCKFGDSSTKAYYLMQMEDYFADDGTSGFTTEFGTFYNGIEELIKDPSNPSARIAMLNYAENFLEYMNNIKINLQNTQADINSEINSEVDHINSLAKEIAILNKQINIIELQGANANELRDKRSLLLDELSEVVDVDTNEVTFPNGKSEFYVTIAGKSLVNNYDCFQLEVVARETKMDPDDVVGLYEIQWTYGEEFDPAASGSIGKLASLIELRDGNNAVPDTDNAAELEQENLEAPIVDFKGVPHYINQIDDFLDKFTARLNEVHSKGVNLYDESTENIPLFILGDDEVYRVNPELMNDPGKLATSTFGSSNVGAIDIAEELMDTKYENTYESGTAEEALAAIITELSIDSKKAQTRETNYKNFKNLIQNQRLSIMGVDQDEESMNLVKYQEAYDLSAKVIQIMSEVYDKLINETGV